ncbi:dioxygenase family protein [Pseudoprimorskyibacter insulae]|uniref:Intradiol ring-cleavage dioxygenases domain-containing protein n=1 Tax=Pseudoprimorskyibacter insulae TaxID=1695997 RepID=A0A2R8AQ43_9RHOB|nr:hypothetical protein [Pseudoprimorskyibacter insulae]SPF78153.1 hypothetical protein PRI8871_00746 [Pseudoprimorskyibacter insulae]
MTHPAFPPRALGMVSTKQFEGPYYFAPPTRRDIRDGQPGLPLDLAIRLTDAATGQPLAGFDVDIWHCDAQGRYSGWEHVDPNRPPEETAVIDDTGIVKGSDATFLRGRQKTDDAGVVRFMTVFPSWYFAREVHIHVMVYQNGAPWLITQLYFDMDLIRQVLEVTGYERGRERASHYGNDWVRYATGSDEGELVNAVLSGGTVFGAASLSFNPKAAPEVIEERPAPEYMDDMPDEIAVWRTFRD